MYGFTAGRAIIAALAIGIVPAAASAATYDVLQQRSSISNDGTGNKSVSGQINAPDPVSQSVVNTSAGSFHLKKRAAGTSDAYEDFIAFCIEVTQSITTSTGSAVSYTENNTLFSNTRRGLISTLLGTAFNPLAGAQHHAATQLAVWKLAYGDISTPTGDAFDVTAKSFENLPGSTFLSFTDGLTNTFESNSTGVFALAQGWLDKLDGAGTDDWTLLSANRVTFLENASSQNLVTYTAPVPVPAAGLLLAGALGGLGLARRRRAAR
ncbi:hypothetical protein DKT77_15210 [Meridianimarinicoccus roseus]|uniref:VPLPA-CTERM sorting domain-containing protein n=1 Tax=Meridianimarinicoccus roseus TaxID=2072018 RepID=A0A2V2LCK8_9RHOB|nr:VPLPA-CTERM sorting domain-containing protein [Meridianimarinicoccus roseus]PWR01491.1 hypothetical protein DKT77_15210 [Meridianimarinicoccus roseus]